MISKLHRGAAVLAFSLLMAGCPGDTILGFAIGDISGLWTAESYVYSPTAGSAATVDLIQRDGASMTLAVDNAAQPPIVSSRFLDGSGGETVGGGVVDIAVGTLTIGPDLYEVDHDGNRITIVTTDMMFDFGSGAESATLTILLNRL